MAWITNVDTSVPVRVVVRRRETGLLLDLVLWAEGTRFRAITLDIAEALQLVDDLIDGLAEHHVVRDQFDPPEVDR